MLNMMPAAILGPPRGHSASPPASRRANLPQFTPEREEGKRWVEMGRRGLFPPSERIP